MRRRRDVRKDTIVVVAARPERGTPESRGEVANRPAAVAKLVARLHREFSGERLL